MRTTYLPFRWRPETEMSLSLSLSLSLTLSPSISLPSLHSFLYIPAQYFIPPLPSQQLQPVRYILSSIYKSLDLSLSVSISLSRSNYLYIFMDRYFSSSLPLPLPSHSLTLRSLLSSSPLLWHIPPLFNHSLSVISSLQYTSPPPTPVSPFSHLSVSLSLQ